MHKGISKNVIPTKVGIQKLLKLLDSGFRRNDEYGVMRDAHKCIRWIVSSLALLALTMGCAKPLVRASAEMMDPVTRSYAADPNQAYYAIRWALTARGYPVAREDLPAGMITTAWVPTKSDSHYLQPFRSRDYGVVPAYHQLEVRVTSEGTGRSRVEITSRLKSVVNFVRSSGRQEEAMLDEIANYLHSNDVGVTNVGVDE